MSAVLEGPSPAPAPINLRDLATPLVPQPDLVLESDGDTAWSLWDEEVRRTRDGIVGEGF